MENGGMMGLMVLAALLVYMLVSVFVIKISTNWPKANNKRPWLWGGLAAFVMYNLVFWDLIPTLVMHKYYCGTQAGFWVYKTPDQWMKENTDLKAEDLRSEGEKMYLGSHTAGWIWNFPHKPFKNNHDRRVAMINSRVYFDSEDIKKVSRVLPIHKFTSFIADAKNDERLAQQVTFGSGYGNPMTTGGILGFKSWLASDNCSGGNAKEDADKSGCSAFINQIVNLGNKS
jgi:hypothetical protein